MDGEEVVKVFKDEPPLRECFVVVVSGDVGKDRVESLKAAGAHSFVAKPLDVKRLLSLMRELLGRPSGD